MATVQYILAILFINEFGISACNILEKATYFVTRSSIFAQEFNRSNIKLHFDGQNSKISLALCDNFNATCLKQFH